MQRLAAPAGWATGIFRAACSRRLSAPLNWTSCGPMPCAPVEIRRLQYTRWGSLDLTAARLDAFEREGVHRLVVSPPIDRVQVQLDDLSAFAEKHLSA